MITDRHRHDEPSPVQGVGFQQHGGGSQGHYLQFCPLQHASRPRGKYDLTQNESTGRTMSKKSKERRNLTQKNIHDWKETICYGHNNHRLAKTRPHVWSMMTSQLKVFINNISERNKNIQRELFPGRNKLLRFEQNRFYGNSLPRGRPSRDRSSCEVLSNPPFSYETFELTWFELGDIWVDLIRAWRPPDYLRNFVTLCQVCEICHGCCGEEEAS